MEKNFFSLFPYFFPYPYIGEGINNKLNLYMKTEGENEIY